MAPMRAIHGKTDDPAFEGISNPTVATTPAFSVLTRRHFFIAAAAFLAFVIYGSLIPFHYRPLPWNEALAQFKSALTGGEKDSPIEANEIVNRLRAALTLRGFHSRSDFLANVLLFVPLGFLVLGSLAVDRPWWMGLVWTPLVLFFGLSLSTAIEFTQTFFPPRCPDLNDILGETLGAGIGAASWLVVGQRVTGACRKIWSPQTGADWSLLLPGYLAFLILIEVLPLDLTLSPADIYHKYREGRIQLIPFIAPPGDPFEWIEKQFWQLALFLPVGWLLSLDRSRIGLATRSWLRVLVFGFLTAGLVEFLQVFVVSRNVETGDIITGSSAILVGWLACTAYPRASRLAESDFRLRRAGRNLQLFLGVVWLGMLLFVNWRPFDFRLEVEPALDRIRQMSWLPFVDYYHGSYLNFLNQVVRKTLLFLPVGLLGNAILTKNTRRRALAVTFGAFGLALVLEIGQVFLPTRYPSITDILLETVGAYCGYILSNPGRGFPESDTSRNRSPQNR
jgi:glycopeptide antibiotics resistance protein